MQKKADLEEEASRASERKDRRSDPGNAGGHAGDGKFEDTPQGGKRRGPGRWVDPRSTGG